LDLIIYLFDLLKVKLEALYFGKYIISYFFKFSLYAGLVKTII